MALWCLALAPTSALAQPFSIDWHTVDGGGHGPITGGAFSLQGTTGQPDASGALTGGLFSLTGGYWAVALPSLPTVSSPSATLVAAITATLNANVTSDGGGPVTERGFVFSLDGANPDPLLMGAGVTPVVVGGTTGAFLASLSSLTPGTTYAFKGYATNGAGTGYTAVSTFTTILPAISISDVTLVEGNSGFTNAVFTVSLSAPSSQTITVSALTADLSAAAGSDYTATGPTLITFAPLATVQTFSVPVVGETALESDEVFQVALSAPTNATLADALGLGTITNDDGTAPSRVFVAESGNDANVCSTQTTPCRSLVGSISQVAINGEIIVLSPGEYDTAPILIGKSVKITSPSGTVAFIRQPITVNAPGGAVVLRGLTIKGAGSSSGVTLVSAASLSVEESTVDSWSRGLDLANAEDARVAVLNSVLLLNTTAVRGAGSAGSRISISDSRFERNGSGLDIAAGAFMVRSSLFTANTSGIMAGGGSVDIRQSEFWNNSTAVLASSGVARISRSHVVGNGVGLSQTGGGALISSGTNIVRGNVTNTSGTITTVPEQ